MSIKGLLKPTIGCPSSSSSSASRPGSVPWHPREQIPDFPPLQPHDDDSDEDEDDDDDTELSENKSRKS